MLCGLFLVRGEDVSPLSARLCRAHANCIENSGILLAIVLAAYLTQKLTDLNDLAYPFIVSINML